MPRIRRFLLPLMLALAVIALPRTGEAQVSVSITVAPPPLPVYVQPAIPGPGWIWAPGYWAWGPYGYYWVPGTWVRPPRVGLLWTPGYWGWVNGFYAWHAGYWGPHVGFYGGINYGFGYGGIGFVGGEWRGGAFYYNRSVTNVSVTNVTNVYNRTVVVNNRSTTSFNGGTGGVQARPTRQEEEYGRERHTAPLSVQSQHERAAAGNRENLASQNHGRPAIAATSRPGDFSRHAAVPARAAGGEYHAPAMSPREARLNAPAANRGNSNSGNRMNTGDNNRNNNKARSNEGFRPLPRRRRTTREMDEATRVTTAIRVAPTTAETGADTTTAVLHSSIARRCHNGRHRVRRRSTPARRLSTTRHRPRHITEKGSKTGR